MNAEQITALIIALATLTSAIFSGISMVIAAQAKLAAEQAKISSDSASASSKENASSIEIVRKDVNTIEKATNSMKDALIASTAKASFSEGREAERTDASAEKAKDTLVEVTKAVVANAAITVTPKIPKEESSKEEAT